MPKIHPLRLHPEGDFWDKGRALFIRDAKARFPQLTE
jgi:hypothetical protein